MPTPYVQGIPRVPRGTGCALSGLLEIRFLVSTAAVASDTTPL